MLSQIAELLARFVVPAILAMAAVNLILFLDVWRGLIEKRRKLSKVLAILLKKIDYGEYSLMRDDEDSTNLARLKVISERLGDAPALEQLKANAREANQKEAVMHLNSRRLEVEYSLARNLIETYPFLGILGTLAAIAVAFADPAGIPAAPPLSASVAAAAIEAPASGAAELSAAAAAPNFNRIMDSFAVAISSTIYGLICAIVFVLFNAAFIAPGVERFLDQKSEIATALSWVDSLARRDASSEDAEP
ncbi:MAG: MotA/TolQ/ExbB proton channel family protein [candidate division BRC1 bacterium ADurb.BinA364]|nr:MAG: MotA/TolQ/ExbB proton channel family protein [candidate division BRC1 bacterium ADurb.BinA364]